MKILITGGAGSIGSNFTHYWAKNYPTEFLCVYDKLTYAGNISNLKELQNLANYAFVKGDICDSEKLKATINKFNIDTIVHFAAESHVDRSITNPGDFINTNVVGTFQILEAVRNKPAIRLHHISTDEVFGSLPVDQPQLKFNETTAYDPKSPYSASKASSDHLVRSYINTYNIKATISNCSNNYGPYFYIEKFIPLIITRALYNEQVPVYGNGLQIRDWIHVEDHCHGIDLILRKGKLGETYLLGGNGEKTNIWLVKKILELLKKPETLIEYVTDRKGHDERYAIDFSKAERELGFKPAKSIEAWLEATINWYITNEDWWKNSKKEAHAIAAKYLAIK